MNHSLTSFIQEYGSQLFHTAHHKFPPLIHEPFTASQGRPPLGAQRLASSGVVHALRQYRAAFVVAEMSTGKTKISLDAAMHFNPRGRYLVLCPPTLVEKWKREAEQEGFQGIILDSPQSVRTLRYWKGPLIAILSREKAKLGPGWQSAVVYRTRLVREGRERFHYRVPTCPRCGKIATDAEGVPLKADKLARKKHRCPCGEALWQQTAPRRVALADYLRRELPRGFFSALILDEAHEYKSGESAQGIVAGQLADHIGRVMALTGTLFGGYASNLFHLFWRFLPGFREEYQRNEVDRFVQEYGLLERISRSDEEEDGRVSRRKGRSTTVKERPGLSPLLLPHLLPYSVFVRLREVASALPPYQEKVSLLEMDPEHAACVETFYHRLQSAVRQALAQGDMRLLGGYLQGALNGPDAIFQGYKVVDPRDPQTTIATLPALEGHQHNKERELLRLVQAELAQGRRVLVYVQNTGKVNQIARLEELLAQHRIRAKGLYSNTVEPQKREAWLERELQRGTQVILTHPKLVQTGLDLIGFPTIVFYQTEYSVYVLRQAARRSWRIGQTKPVRVVFMAYQNTLQAQALALIATKTRNSLAIEGELVEGGLTAMSDENPTLLLAGALAGTISLDWKGELLGLEEVSTALEEPSLPPPPARELSLEQLSTLVLPQLKEERVVRVGKTRVVIPAGQPTLFEL